MYWIGRIIILQNPVVKKHVIIRIQYDFYKKFEIPPFIQNVTIVGNPSYRINNGKNVFSRQYLQKVFNILQQRNMTVQIVQHKNADIDIAIMLHAHFFVPGKGGFSAIARQYARHHSSYIFEQNKWWKMPEKKTITWKFL